MKNASDFFPKWKSEKKTSFSEPVIETKRGMQYTCPFRISVSQDYFRNSIFFSMDFPSASKR